MLPQPFNLKTYTITASAGTGGSISPSGGVNVQSGANQTFTITPNTGYKIADVTVDGVSQGAITSYTFSAVNANHTIVASFTSNTYYPFDYQCRDWQRQCFFQSYRNHLSCRHPGYLDGLTGCQFRIQRLVRRLFRDHDYLSSDHEFECGCHRNFQP